MNKRHLLMQVIGYGVILLLLVISANSYGQLDLKNSGNTNLIRVLQNGNVLIPNVSTNDLGKLHVAGYSKNSTNDTPWGAGPNTHNFGIFVYNPPVTDMIRTRFYHAICGAIKFFERDNNYETLHKALSGVLADANQSASMATFSAPVLSYSDYPSNQYLSGLTVSVEQRGSLPAAYKTHAIRCVNSVPSPGNNDYNIYAFGSAKNYFEGKIGIGTTNPVAQLHIYDAGPATICIGSNYNGYCELQMGVANMAARYNSQQDLYLISDTDNNNNDATAAGITFACNHYEVDVAPYKRLGQFYENGNLWILGNCSAESFTDRTPYPQDVQTAYAAVFSMKPLPAGQYQSEDKANQLDHGQLHPFIRAENGERDLSATVSAQNEVIKDLVRQIAELKAELAELKKSR